MPRYAYKAVNWRTGRVVADLPLTAGSFQCHLTGGRMDASLPLAQLALPASHSDRWAPCRDMLGATTPDLNTVLLVRDGKIMGEWMIWTRERSNTKDPVKLGGVQVQSWLEHVAVDGWTKRTNRDALTVAHDLAQLALDRPPGIDAMTVASVGTSGNVIPTVEYPDGSNYIGKLIDDLADGINGFDWWIDTQWDPDQATPHVKRTIRFGYPRRGRALQAYIDLPRFVPGQSGIEFSLTEDGTQVATAVYVTGTGEGDTQLVSRGLNSDLFATYPIMDRIDSRADQDQQVLLDAYSAAEAAASRSPDLPTSVTLRADGDLQLGSYEPGDSLLAKAEACANFPDGYQAMVRILGYTMTPPQDGNTETVQVEIGRDDSSAFDA